jgi:hypothetical protein
MGPVSKGPTCCCQEKRRYLRLGALASAPFQRISASVLGHRAPRKSLRHEVMMHHDLMSESPFGTRALDVAVECQRACAVL